MEIQCLHPNSYCVLYHQKKDNMATFNHFIFCWSLHTPWESEMETSPNSDLCNMGMVWQTTFK